MGFATAINCMDGRVQRPVIDFVRGRFGVEYVDNVTEPGPVRILADRGDPAAVESICRRVDISLNRHHSRGIAVVAHGDCAGNPVDEATQRDQLAEAAAFLRGRYAGVEVLAVWVDEQWRAREVGPASGGAP